MLKIIFSVLIFFYTPLLLALEVTVFEGTVKAMPIAVTNFFSDNAAKGFKIVKKIIPTKKIANPTGL